MKYTQVELTSGARREVWWIPVPSGRAKVGERLAHESLFWQITQVCTSLSKESLLSLLPDVRVAHDFKRQEENLSYISF